MFANKPKSDSMAYERDGRIHLAVNETPALLDCQANLFARPKPPVLTSAILSGWSVEQHLFTAALLKGLYKDHPHAATLESKVASALEEREISYTNSGGLEEIKKQAAGITTQARLLRTKFIAIQEKGEDNAITGEHEYLDVFYHLGKTAYSVNARVYVVDKDSKIPANIYIGWKPNGSAVRCGALAMGVLLSMEEATAELFRRRTMREIIVTVNGGKVTGVGVADQKIQEAIHAFSEASSILPEPGGTKKRLIENPSRLLSHYVRRNPLSNRCGISCPLSSECSHFTKV